MFTPVLTMEKRIKYLISSLLTALTFFLFISLPYESRYYGLLVGVVLVVFCFWFGLGVVFERKMDVRIMTALLPVGFFVGFGLFSVLLPYTFLLSVVLSIFFGAMMYVLFLVENVFMVAIGYKTVPLYRAAYTVSLIVTLLGSFFLFNSIFSFKFAFWVNGLLTFLASLVVFYYHYFAVAIELPDDGERLNRNAYVIIPALLITELGLVFSFWPVGIFKGSIYLVAAIYVICALTQADIRDRLFRRTWMAYSWVGVAMVMAALLTTNWG